MEKINVAEILKTCPKGMELDCIDCDGIVTFEEVIDCGYYPIKISIKYGNESFNHTLTRYGQTCRTPYNKCVIFPKGKTTWEGFVPPCKFKDGDIIYTLVEGGFEFISIFKKTSKTRVYSYIDLGSQFFLENSEGLCTIDVIISQRLATEEEKATFFKAIKDNGYKWNPETKTLEKLIEPKFKVGDRIKHRLTEDVYKVLFVLSNGYGGGVYDVAVTNEIGKSIDIKEQDSYELVPNKFDISALVPFESRVLVRDCKSHKWNPAIWGLKTDDIDYPYIVVGGISYCQCIPYEGNEHLLGTKDDCLDFYKTWEE